MNIRGTYNEKFNNRTPVILAYLDDKVQFLESAEELDNLDLENLLELRIFDSEGELRYWRNHDGKLEQRYVDDAGKQKHEVEFFLWEIAVDGQAPAEQRGMLLKLPKHLNISGNSAAIKVINYYEFDENGLINILDSRFAGICSKEKEQQNA